MIRQTVGKLLMALLVMPVAIACRETPSESVSQEQTAVSEAQSLNAVATFLPMYWFTKAVAGDKAQVTVLIPPGAEVHEYQAKPEDVTAIATADILIKNGLGLEEFLEDTVKNAGNSDLKQIDASVGIQTVEEISPVMNPLKQTHAEHGEHDHDTAAEHGDEHHHHHVHEGGNPHVWLDPVLAKQQVENIRDGLIAADPENQAIYEANAADYIQKLDQLNAEFQQQLQQYPNCTFITFHDAYPYLAQRYGLQQVAVVSIPETNLSPKEVQTTVEAVENYNVKAILGEPGVDNKLLETLSQDLNLTLYAIDPLVSGPLEPQHYFTAMKSNLQTLETACK